MDYKEVKQEVKQAQQNFDYAEPAYIDAAIYQLNAATYKFNQYIKEIKSCQERNQ